MAQKIGRTTGCKAKSGKAFVNEKLRAIRCLLHHVLCLLMPLPTTDVVCRQFNWSCSAFWACLQL